MSCSKLDVPVYYQSVDELSEPIQTEITGVIPKWLSGTLLRNGPGKFEVGETSYSHAFDGLALLQQFVIKDGSVTYFNKYLRSQTYLVNMKAGKIVEGELGTPACPDPCKNMFVRLRSHFFPKDYTDNASVNFCCIKGKIYALTEVPIISEIDSKSLETLNRVKLSDEFQETLKQIFHASPHPQEDEDGNVYNLCTGIDKQVGLAYIITKIPPSYHLEEEKPLDGRSIVAVIPSSRRQSYSHSFGMTQKYFIFIQQPLTVNLWKLAAARFIRWSVLDTFSWDSTKPTIFNVISRETGQMVLQFSTEPFFFLHVANAYDLGDDVIIDVCCYKDSKIFSMLYLKEFHAPSREITDINNNPGDVVESFTTAQLRRYRLPVRENQQSEASSQPATLKSTNIESKYDVLSESSVDLPRINEKYKRLPYRYLYGACSNTTFENGLSYKRLLKVDVEEKTTIAWSEDGCLVSEPVFIANPDNEEEDNGVVLSAVYDTKRTKSFLLVIDARSFTEVARAEVSVRFAPTFHGYFMPDTKCI